MQGKSESLQPLADAVDAVEIANACAITEPAIATNDETRR